MPRPLKLALAVVGILILVVFGAVGIAAMMFDPNDYRDKITQAVKQQTGRELKLGDIQLSVFPWLKARVADVSFSNAEGFGDQPMAEVKLASVGVQVWPLLSKREVKVSTVELEGLKLDLAKNAEGKSNWEGLTQAKEEEEGEPKPEDSGDGVKLESVDIAGVALRDATIAYRDAQSKQAYRIEKLNLETGNLQPGEPVDIEASLSAFAEAQKMSADLAFSATVMADMIGQKATVDGLKLDLKTRGDGLDAAINVVGDIAANLETQVVDVKGLKLDFKTAMKDLNAEGSLSTQLQAAVKTQQFNLANLVLDATAKGAAIPGGAQVLKLSGNAAYDVAKGALKFNDGKISTAGLNISTSITGEGLSGDSPRLSGPIQIASFSPRTLLKTLGQADIKTSDAKVLNSASLSTRYSGSFTSARFDDLKLKLDDTSIAGTLAVRDFATQALEFALKLDRIDADRYLAPAEGKPVDVPTSERTAAEKKDLNATEIPLQALEKLNASGTFDIAELKLKGATLKDVRLKVDGPKNQPKLVKLDAKAYGGEIATSTRIAPGAKPTYALNTSLSTMQLAPMLQNFVGKEYVSGLGNIKLDLSSAGATVGDARRSLNGDIALNFQNGAVKGFNLGQILRQGQALLKGEKLAANEPKETDFTAISFAAKIVNGVLKSDQLNAQSPLFRLAGNGEIDLVQETINYLASPTVVGSSKGQGGKGLEELAGLTIPIKLTGSLYAPKYKLDLQTALKQKAGDELRGKVADKLLGGESGQAMSEPELKQKAGEKLNKELGRGLEKLFGRKKDAAPAPTAEPAAEPAAAEPAPEAAPADAAPAP
ncbi:MAG: AsmA family protein [Panacagrimonas sp.]